MGNTTANAGAQGNTEAPASKGTESKAGEQAGAGAGDHKAGDQGGAGGTGDQKTGDEGKPKTGAEGQQGKAGEEPPAKKGAEAGAAGDTATKKAPAKYELQVPDDAKSLVRDRHVALIEQIARDNDWTNEEAQAELEARLAAAVEDRNELVKTWEDETKADKTWGGDNLAETQRLANQAIDSVFPKGHAMRDRFLQTLQGTGAAVKLEIVAFLATLGKKLGEDAPRHARSSTPGQKDDASLMYDHPSSKALENAT